MPTLNGTSGSDFLVGSILDDTINGKSGSDILVGDLFNAGAGHPDIILECNAGVGADFYPLTDGANNVSHASHNDWIDDGSGSDRVVGDAFAIEYAELQLNALSGTGGLFGGDGGNNNSVRCFSDIFVPGTGSDLLVGDVFHIDGQDDAELNAAAGSSGLGHFSFFPHGPGGNGGDGNLTEAFNDFMSDDAPNAGGDLIVGDVYGIGGSTEFLNALAGAAGRDGGDGGNDNVVRAFNDQLVGGTGSDQLVGDVLGENGNDDMVFNAFAGTGGDGATGGDGGDNNTVDAFADILFGGTGGDLLIGDAFQNTDPTQDIDFFLKAGAAGSGGSLGGTGNTLNAFSDSLFGNQGDDFLIGDSFRVSGTDAIEVLVAGSAGNTINAFQDHLDGGLGSDRLIGDFFGGGTSDPALLDISGSFTGRNRLFADSLYGDSGSDQLTGGLGADTMTGGSGKDVFFFVAGDLFDLSGGVPLGTPPVDLITDFKPFGADVLNFSDLLSSLGFDLPGGDNINDWLAYQVVGNNSTILIDQDGAGGAFTTFESMLDLANFTSIANAVSTMVSLGEVVII